MSERFRVPLGELLRVADEPCVVQEGEQYPNFGIYSFGRGLFRKSPINGMSTSAKTLFRARAGNFIYSRLFAFEGAYGMVDDEFDGFFVSNEYPSFEVDRSRILPEFLAAYFRFPLVWEAIGMGSKGVGSRRIRIHPDKVLSHRIALPSIDEQHAIVARLDSLAAKTRQVTAHLDAIEADADQLLAQQFQAAIAGAPYRSMAEVAPLVRREVAIDPDTSYTELGVRSFYKGTFHRRTVAGSEFTWQKVYWIEADDLIFSNIMAWEQAIALARPEDHGCVGNHRMLTCLTNRQQALPAFLAYYFTTEEGFAKVYAASPGTAARNRTLVAGNLEAIEVPIPPLVAQQAFVDLQGTITALRARHAAIRADSAAMLPSVLERTFVQ
jgi:type I restriction enzyme S subunit